MEVIEIGKAQLIFVLNRTEMTEYCISSYDNNELMREGFSRLVCDLGVDSQFLTGVLVQIFDSNNGGCEMFVTKLADSIGADISPLSDKKYIYIFPTLDNMLSACKLLYSQKARGGSAYTDKAKSKYYLSLSEESRYLSEFEGIRCKEGTADYLSEYCTLICHDAVEALAPLA